jgi:hypothetical protein
MVIIRREIAVIRNLARASVVIFLGRRNIVDVPNMVVDKPCDGHDVIKVGGIYGHGHQADET